jgi:hypothetical protein
MNVSVQRAPSWQQRALVYEAVEHLIELSENRHGPVGRPKHCIQVEDQISMQRADATRRAGDSPPGDPVRDGVLILEIVHLEVVGGVPRRTVYVVAQLVCNYLADEHEAQPGNGQAICGRRQSFRLLQFEGASGHSAVEWQVNDGIVDLESQLGREAEEQAGN